MRTLIIESKAHADIPGRSPHSKSPTKSHPQRPFSQTRQRSRVRGVGRGRLFPGAGTVPPTASSVRFKAGAASGSWPAPSRSGPALWVIRKGAEKTLRGRRLNVEAASPFSTKISGLGSGPKGSLQNGCIWASHLHVLRLWQLPRLVSCRSRPGEGKSQAGATSQTPQGAFLCVWKLESFSS